MNASDEPLPSVSAIIVNWNGGERLLESLSSLFAQTYPDLEILLVDNGSTDGSADAAEERWGEKLRILRNQHNEGFAGGNNRAFREAKGDWLFLLNNDAVAEPRAIEELMTFARGRRELGMLACRVMQREAPNYYDSTGLLLYPDGVCRCRGWNEKDVGQYDRSEEVLAPHGCAAAYRKAMLDDVGHFDETYFAYLEDLDLGMRGQLAGWWCWYVPSAVVHHAKSSTFGNYSKFKAYHVERNRIWNAVKLMPRYILLISPLFTVNRYLMQAYAGFTHQGISSKFMKEYSYAEQVVLMARAYGSAFLRLPEMIAKRRQVGRARRLTTEQWYHLISRYKLDAIELALKS